MLYEVTIHSKKQDEMIDITARVQEFADREKVGEGLAVIYCPHTTAGITINENADPDVQTDFLRRLAELYPWEMAKDRHLEGNSAAHLKASTVGLSQIVPIRSGKLLLGRWQAIYFCEFDGPRTRTCYVKILSENKRPELKIVPGSRPV
jgi:secondary thiamine-phosphate synthase enzyme